MDVIISNLCIRLRVQAKGAESDSFDGVVGETSSAANQSSSSGCDGSSPLNPKLFGGADNSFTEMVQPQAIDNYARREGIARISDPRRILEPARRSPTIIWRRGQRSIEVCDDRHETGFHDWPRASAVAAVKQVKGLGGERSCPSSRRHPCPVARHWGPRDSPVRCSLPRRDSRADNSPFAGSDRTCDHGSEHI